jgi:hypothetical protein
MFKVVLQNVFHVTTEFSDWIIDMGSAGYETTI